MKLLLRIQEALNALSAHPLTFLVAAVFLGGWLTGYFASSGKFDPGLGIGNLIINGLGLLLMFAACSLSARAARGTSLHEKIDSLHEKIDAQGLRVES